MHIDGRTLYEYKVLPFGMSLSPKVFVKITQVAVASLRCQGVRLATYVLSASSSHECFHASSTHHSREPQRMGCQPDMDQVRSTQADLFAASAFAHDWPRGLLYALPMLHLIQPTLERVRIMGLSVLLVALAWGSWRSEIAPLLFDEPMPLPPLRALLSQANCDIFHPRPVELDLHVWPV